jgi:hypothetical protein
MASGYSHSRALRFWIIRGSASGAGMRTNRSATTAANVGLRYASTVSRAMSAAVE